MIATVTDKGQVTLPKALRERLGIKPGTKIEFELQDAGSLRLRVMTRGAEGLFGLLAAKGEATKSLDEIDAGIASEVSARARR